MSWAERRCVNIVLLVLVPVLLLLSSLLLKAGAGTVVAAVVVVVVVGGIVVFAAPAAAPAVSVVFVAVVFAARHNCRRMEEHILWKGVQRASRMPAACLLAPEALSGSRMDQPHGTAMVWAHVLSKPNSPYRRWVCLFARPAPTPAGHPSHLGRKPNGIPTARLQFHADISS